MTGMAATHASAQLVLPDTAIFIDGSSIIPADGYNYTIMLQLRYHDVNYTDNQIGVFLWSSNTSIINLAKYTTAVVDTNGLAIINITTDKYTGSAVVFASLFSPDSSIVVSKTYRVVKTGNVSGIITDPSGMAIPGATVTLNTLNNSSKGEKVSLGGNPAVSAGADSGTPGAYALSYVPYGSYYLEASIDTQSSGQVIDVTGPTAGRSLAIAGYYMPTPTPEPTLEPTPAPTPTPVPATPTPFVKTSTGDTARQTAWIIGAGVVLAVLIIIVQLLRKKK